MTREELIARKESEYSLLNSFTKNYRMPVSALDDYRECLDRIRALNTKIELLG